VERVVLNALVNGSPKAFEADVCAFGDWPGIVFGAATDAKQRPGFPPDPPSPKELVPANLSAFVLFLEPAHQRL